MDDFSSESLNGNKKYLVRFWYSLEIAKILSGFFFVFHELFPVLQTRLD